jgi:hypothetical protein
VDFNSGLVIAYVSRRGFGDPTMQQRLLSEIENIDLSKADKEPWKFLSPCIKAGARDCLAIAVRLRQQFSAPGEYTFQNHDLTRSQHLMFITTQAKKNLQRFVYQCPSSFPPRLQEVLLDFNEAYETAAHNVEMCKSALQIQEVKLAQKVAKQSRRQVKQSRRQTNSVRRFVFFYLLKFFKA